MIWAYFYRYWVGMTCSMTVERWWADRRKSMPKAVTMMPDDMVDETVMKSEQGDHCDAGERRAGGSWWKTLMIVEPLFWAGGTGDGLTCWAVRPDESMIMEAAVVLLTCQVLLVEGGGDGVGRWTVNLFPRRTVKLFCVLSNYWRKHASNGCRYYDCGNRKRYENWPDVMTCDIIVTGDPVIPTTVERRHDDAVVDGDVCHTVVVHWWRRAMADRGVREMMMATMMEKLQGVEEPVVKLMIRWTGSEGMIEPVLMVMILFLPWSNRWQYRDDDDEPTVTMTKRRAKW